MSQRSKVSMKLSNDGGCTQQVHACAMQWQHTASWLPQRAVMFSFVEVQDFVRIMYPNATESTMCVSS